MKLKGHQFIKEDTRVLDRESNWFKRGVKEAIHIRRRKPDLNLDKGRHHLPPCYNQLLSRDRRSTALSKRDHVTSQRS